MKTKRKTFAKPHLDWDLLKVEEGIIDGLQSRL